MQYVQTIKLKKEYLLLSIQVSLIRLGIGQRNISIIGIDFAGGRRGKEHTTMDQHCVNHGVFIVENLCYLEAVLENKNIFIVHTYLMNYTNMIELPCRVIAEINF